MLSEARYNVLLRQLNAVARKVFSAVPLAEPWESKRVRAEMERLGLAAPSYVVLEGCLNTLKESGLVNEPARGLFIRAPYRSNGTTDTSATTVLTLSPNSIAIPITTKPKEEPMPAQQPQQSPIERLGAYAANLRTTAASLEAQARILREQADKLEEVGVQVDEDSAEAKEAVNLMRSMRALMGGK